jgi:hypothetical protein
VGGGDQGYGCWHCHQLTRVLNQRSVRRRSQRVCAHDEFPESAIAADDASFLKLLDREVYADGRAMRSLLRGAARNLKICRARLLDSHPLRMPCRRCTGRDARHARIQVGKYGYRGRTARSFWASTAGVPQAHAANSICSQALPPREPWPSV